MKAVVTGNLGFIGSHLVDRLLELGYEVSGIDNGRSGKNYNPKIQQYAHDISAMDINTPFIGADVVFHLAAIARTPWCIEDPVLCYKTNVMGTLNVLEKARREKVKRVVLASSNVVYAFQTPYRTSKEAVEGLGRTYTDMYGLSVMSLRFSNVYGKRQSEEGIAPNVFAALRKSRNEEGHLTITGDGEQSRDYTHVSDIVEGLIAASKSDYTGEPIDLCTGVNTSLNVVAKYFDCPVEYTAERPGDVKHIYQDPKPAKKSLGWTAKVKLAEGIKDVL